MSYCDCGADDCRRCRPGNFRHGEYIGDMDEDELDEFEEGYQAHLESKFEQARDDALDNTTNT